MKEGFVIWLTGLSGSGKTTIAKETKNYLAYYYNIHNVIILDGDDIRKGLNKDLSFSLEDRTENIKRIAEIAKLLMNQNYIIIVAAISPRKSQRELAKNIVGEDSFLEVFIAAPLRICKERDPKGLYKAAERGEIKNFTGITDPYELPSPENSVWLLTEFNCIPSCVESLTSEIIREFGI